MFKKIILMAALAVSANTQAATMKGGFYCDGLRDLAALVTALSEHNNAEAMTVINRGTCHLVESPINIHSVTEGGAGTVVFSYAGRTEVTMKSMIQN